MIKFKHTSQDWMDRITEGLEYRQKYAREDRWASLEAMHQNLPNSGADTGPNIIQEMADAITGRLQLDQISVTIGASILDPRSVDTYPYVQAIDNWLYEELNLVDVFEMASLHSYLFSTGIVKLGYDSQYGYAPDKDVNPGDPLGMTLTQFSTAGKRLEFNNINPGMPWMGSVLPHDFVVPWGTKGLDDAPWCAERFFRHIDTFNADPKYTNKKKVVPNLSMEDVIASYQTVGRESMRLRRRRTDRHVMETGITSNAEFVELWEIHNRADGRIIVISDHGVHRNEIDALQIDGLPYKSVSFVKHPRTFWSTPQAQYLEFHQAEENDIVQQASIQRRMNSFKLLMRENFMDPDELDKVLSPETGIIGTFKGSGNPANDMITLPQSNNFQLYQDMQFTKGNAREAIGFSRNQTGEFDQSSRRTATEASLVNQGSEVRQEPRTRSMRKLYKDCFRFMNQIIFTFWKTPRMIQLPDGSWPTFTGEELRAEYGYKVTIGPNPAIQHQQRVQQAFALYTQLAQDPRVNQEELVNYFKRTMGDPEIDRLFTPQKQGVQNALPLPAQQIEG